MAQVKTIEQANAYLDKAVRVCSKPVPFFDGLPFHLDNNLA